MNLKKHSLSIRVPTASARDPRTGKSHWTVPGATINDGLPSWGLEGTIIANMLILSRSDADTIGIFTREECL